MTDPDRRAAWLARLEFAYVVAALLLLTLGPLYQLRVRFGGPIVTPDLIDDQFVQGTFAVIDGVALALLATRRGWWARQRALVLALAALVATIGLSTLWSHDRTRTWGQAVQFAGTGVFALYLGVCHRAAVQARLLFVALHLGGATAAFAVAREWVGSRDRNNVWTGIYFNRNSLGPVAVLGLLSAVAVGADAVRSLRAPSDPAGRRAALAWLVAAVVAIGLDLRLEAGARSVTPILGLVVAAGVGAAVVGLGLLVDRRALGSRRADRILAGATALVVLVGFLGWRRFSVAIGRSPTLESRTGLWGLVVDTWQQRPVFGHGWMSVWTDAAFQEKVKAVANEPLPNAHNGYLESLLGMGVLGALALASVLGVVLRRVWRVSDVTRSASGLLPLALVAYGLTVNLMETFVGANLLVWVLVLAAAATVAQDADLVRRPAPTSLGDRLG